MIKTYSYNFNYKLISRGRDVADDDSVMIKMVKDLMAQMHLFYDFLVRSCVYFYSPFLTNF